MEGKTALLTGGTSGIGLATATKLARLGANMVVAGRDPEKGTEAVGRIRDSTGNPNVRFLSAELSKLDGVRRLAGTVLKDCPRLDVLINNAGVLLPHREITSEGREMTTAVNHLAPFLLTHLLLGRLKDTGSARIINASSAAHSFGRIDMNDMEMVKGYRGFSMYSRTKLESVLFTYALSRRLKGSTVTVNSFHPGTVRTGLFRHGGLAVFLLKAVTPFMISAEKASETPVYLATSPELGGSSGGYYVKCEERRTSHLSYDIDLQERVWKWSSEASGIPAD